MKWLKIKNMIAIILSMCRQMISLRVSWFSDWISIFIPPMKRSERRDIVVPSAVARSDPDMIEPSEDDWSVLVTDQSPRERDKIFNLLHGWLCSNVFFSFSSSRDTERHLPHGNDGERASEASNRTREFNARGPHGCKLHLHVETVIIRGENFRCWFLIGSVSDADFGCYKII